MGINKQFRVTFDVTATMSDDQEREFLEDLLTLAYGVDDKRQAHIVAEAITKGHEAALAFIMQSGLREAIKDIGKELSCSTVTVRFSPATVRVTK
ncbi:Gp5.5-like host HNS inhibition [Klebsiella phage vB_Kpn_K11PH164C1]|uniref:Gp5.5-like host HNS inhibition n=1 Tax=Klebsiella phage vB_Kpn_K11PH164C1 TaxID=3071618 RepID=A0AAV1MEE0_9CAUD|nr:Gp5.5-like host HNS inhibition [Klebsiella phage vB_Kpn_K11PH164C1]